MITWKPGYGGRHAIPPNGDRPVRWRRRGIPGRRARRYTLRWARRFAGTPEQVGAARRFVAALLADTPGAAEAAWVTSELATNAISHSRSADPGGSFEVQLVRGRSWADIRVIDAGGGTIPAVRAPTGGLAEQGRGLYAIGVIALGYGTFLRRSGHRVVWARVPIAARGVAGARN